MTTSGDRDRANGPGAADGRVVWVTGASSGIGEALVHALDRRGDRVVLSARREERLEEVRRACRHPERHLVVPLDLARPETCTAAAERVLEHFGRIDRLINNGGISQRSLAEETDLAVDRRLIEVDYLGTVALTKAVLPSMLGRREGGIVVVSSLVGKIGTPFRSSYSAAKHALHGFFESLRAEIHGRGVGITLACPGFVRTDVSVNALTADGTPLGTMDRAQERGMAPERCAEKILRAADRGRAEALIGGKERFAVHLARFLPGVYRWLVRRVNVR